jgi:hypothetical protein
MSEEENRLMASFKRLSPISKTEVISRALLVEKIENGIRRQYGLPEDKDPAAGTRSV